MLLRRKSDLEKLEKEAEIRPNLIVDQFIEKWQGETFSWVGLVQKGLSAVLNFDPSLQTYLDSTDGMSDWKLANLIKCISHHFYKEEKS